MFETNSHCDLSMKYWETGDTYARCAVSSLSDHCVPPPPVQCVCPGLIHEVFFASEKNRFTKIVKFFAETDKVVLVTVTLLPFAEFPAGDKDLVQESSFIFQQKERGTNPKSISAPSVFKDLSLL